MRAIIGPSTVSTNEKTSPDDASRVEFSGPEQLDRVLIHLREVRERAALKSRAGRLSGARVGRAPPPEEKLSFDRAPEAVATPEASPKPPPGDAAASPVDAIPASRLDLALGSSARPQRAAAAGEEGVPRTPAGAPEPAVQARQTGSSVPRPAGVTPGERVAREVEKQPDPPTSPATDADRGAPPDVSAAPEPLPVSASAADAVGKASPDTPSARRSPMAAAARASERLTRALGADTAEAPQSLRPPQASSQEAKAPGRQTVDPGKTELFRAVLESRPAFKAIALFSLASNVLMLAGPLFMLQVYDRVMTSGSMPTLIALSALTAAIYGVIGLLEMVRSRVIVRVGVEIDQRLSERVFAAALRRGLVSPGGSASYALRELDQLRQFVSGPGPLTFFDAPWTPVYLLVIYLTHWTLGVAATVGAGLLLVIAWLSEVKSRGPMAEASKATQRSLELAESGQRNAEAITAMGMLGAYRGRWQVANRDALAWQVHAADKLGGLSSLSKAMRLLLQSMMLAIGAALAVNGMISSGAIIAATIIFGRALAPVEQAVSQWRGFIKARESYTKLEELLKAFPEPQRKTSLPPPKGRLEARNLRVAAPDGRSIILAGINFAVQPGQMLAIIGPSASGKSSLVRSLVGLWPTAGGEISIDGARLEQWNADELGRHLGYLPQSVELFSGTVRENISRFDPKATDAAVIEAARAAHAHDMITALPKGYDTELGAFGAYLSAGQRQRIGLARALYGDPALVVLDEPNANLDRTGDEALASAIDGMRARGRAVVLVSHRVQAIGKADLLLYLERGQQRAFGPRDEVLRFLQQGGQAGQAGQQGGRPAQAQGQAQATAGGGKS
ncbi:MAG: type I secretion system permease/ATPase [Hyphomicrobiaceae bacterium]